MSEVCACGVHFCAKNPQYGEAYHAVNMIREKIEELILGTALEAVNKICETVLMFVKKSHSCKFLAKS